MNYLFWTIAIISAVAILLVASYYALNALVRHRLKPRYLTIAEKVRVRGDWSEFPTVKPERRRNESQHIFLAVPEYEFDYPDGEFAIKLADGTIVNPQIQVEDALGRTYATRDTT